MRLTLIAPLLLLQISCAARLSRERFVDVTAATISPEPGHGVEFGSCSSGDLKRQDPCPLQLELLKTDRRTYRRMERVLVDVRIKNISNGLQQLFVTVPRDAVVGQWNLTIRRRGVSSGPFPVVIEQRQQTDPGLRDVSPNSEVVLAPTAEASSNAASIVDVVRVGPSDQIVVLHDGPDRPPNFNIVEGDPLVLHFENPTAGEIVVTFRARRQSIHLRSVRRDEYNVAVRLCALQPRK